jgi:hypothetical protein
MRLVAIFIASKTQRRNGAPHGGGNLGNKATNAFPLFFSKLNRCTLSAHRARKLIAKTDGQTKTEKDMYAKLYVRHCGCMASLHSLEGHSP